MGLTVKKFRKLADGTLEVREDVKEEVLETPEEAPLEDDSKDTKGKKQRSGKTKKKNDGLA
tara:strand:- start:1352 stop:1534 length:183 start_codon:yes stop_codon:yes gene_type:complete